MIFLEKQFNALIFTICDDEPLDPERNYIPDIMGALSELVPSETIHFVIDLDRIPMVFLLYIRKIWKETPQVNIITYLRKENVTSMTEVMKEFLTESGVKYKNMSEYPWELPC